MKLWCFAGLICCFVALAAARADEPAFKRNEDVIYGRKPGLALTMDVFTPDKPKGVGVVVVISGGWFSAHEAINPAFFAELLKRGYTVFAVVHGSQPKYTIPEIIGDMHRSIRFIRHHAADYKIDPGQIGIMGGSAGGHLSLMQGTDGKDGDPKSADPVERENSRVQAVACFFPPTDFLNYGKPGEIALGRGTLEAFRAPFDFQEFNNTTHHFEPITDVTKILEIGKEISPITHVSADDAPTLIYHGDADHLVPIQQSQIMVEALKKAGVKAELLTKAGAGHGWPDWLNDTAKLADWFDQNLKAPAGEANKDAAKDQPSAQPAAEPKAEPPKSEEPKAEPPKASDAPADVPKAAEEKDADHKDDEKK